METEELNLCKLLKGHEGEIFYSTIFGEVQLIETNFITYNFPIKVQNPKSPVSTNYYFTKEGKYDSNGECVLFPSKENHDWNKWAEENILELPKTWDELKSIDAGISEAIHSLSQWITNESPIIKSAIALLKIHQLIQYGYGGNVTNNEWENGIDWKYHIYIDDNKLKIHHTAYKFLIAFHTKEQAEEFLSHPENVQLFNNFYMK